MNSQRRLSFLFIILGLPTFVFAQRDEYMIKAVYLERFTRFVEWPKESGIVDTSKPFIITIISRNPFGSILEQIYSKQKIKNREVKIRNISNTNEIKGCHLLFIPSSNRKKLSEILAFTAKKPILTVSDTQSFAEKGVLINLFLAENKIRFEINETAVRESGLYMSYHLLKYAKVVNPMGAVK